MNSAAIDSGRRLENDGVIVNAWNPHGPAGASTICEHHMRAPKAKPVATQALDRLPGHSLCLFVMPYKTTPRLKVSLYKGESRTNTQWLSFDPAERVGDIRTKLGIGADELLPHFLKAVLQGT